ncbi:MAG: YihA family ribosome biogenesis GTP-binding protein [Lachnospiraceae bacterium]|nr:YihA family ribosome biogenesis GTP-binding protein [Lachnospiraceae bacterium]
MKIRKTELETVCGITSRLPENAKGEVAFAGKSNVGKSSLINALMNRKALARVSQKPGKTQTINFYHINEGVTKEESDEKGFAPDCYLVDLPGYGYAGVPEEEKAKWGPMIERYLHGSKQLKAVFLLVDIRHEPSRNDIQMFEWIRANGFTPIIIATKKDKLKKAQVAKNLSVIRKALHIKADAPMAAFSAVTKEGLDDVWQIMKDAVTEL